MHFLKADFKPNTVMMMMMMMMMMMILMLHKVKLFDIRLENL